MSHELRVTGSSAVAVVLLSLVAGGLAGCAEGKGVAAGSRSDAGLTETSKGSEAAAEEEAIAVAAVPLQRGRIESVLRFSTNLEAESAVEVHSQAARRVTKLLVEEGDWVEQGQTLLQLQDDEQRSGVERVQSQLAKAQREFERQQRLYDQDLISEQAFSEATYELEQLRIALADAERSLSYTTVKAPIAGVITQRLVSLGDHIQENQHLFDLVDFDSIVARIFVPEKELRRLSPGQPARVVAQAMAGRTHAASIERIAPTVDPRSGTVKVTLGIPRTPELRPGMYVEVELVAEVDEDALLVPKRALVYDQDQVFVFRVDADSRVERRLVEPLIENRDFVKVAGGVAPGELIVVAGQAGLKDGAEVRLLDLEEALETFAGGAS